MPALDAPRERVSCDRRRRVERRSIANFHHWAAGFCVGDFSEHALRRGRAVFCGVLTTAVGFLALVLSGAMSFSQLGVLIAIGIFVAGLFMCSILFLFVRDRQSAIRYDWLFDIVRKYVRWTVRKPAPMLIFSGAVLLLLTVIGFSPIPPLHFQASTRSLQPKNIRANRALEEIMHKMPVRWEPVL